MNLLNEILSTKSSLTLPLFLIFLVFNLTSCKKEKDRIESIYEEPGYAIGEVSTWVKRPLKVTYSYNYAVDGVDYVGKEIARGIGQDGLTDYGTIFLVVYKISDPTESDLNTNYIIENEQEFQALLVEFEDSPPRP